MDKAKLIILLLFISVIASGYPRSGTYETLPKKAREISENDVENPRTDSRAQRRASENKRPWDKDQSFLDMEGFVAPPYGPPNIPNPDIVQDDANDKQDKANLGCAFYSPNIVSGHLCDNNSYKLRMGLLTGVVTDWDQSGIGSASYDGDMTFNVTWPRYVLTGEQKTVYVEATSLEDGSKSYCEGSVKFLCAQCECTGAEPTIYASDTVIDAGDSITLYVDSGELACPPFTWEVNDVAYSITSHTYADLETATLTANAGTCGGVYGDGNISVIVTVTDYCGNSDTILIRNTEGDWDTSLTCNNLDAPLYDDIVERIVDDKRYVLAIYHNPSLSQDGACTGSEQNDKGYNSICSVYALGNSPYDEMLVEQNYNAARRNGSSSYCDGWFDTTYVLITRTTEGTWVCP